MTKPPGERTPRGRPSAPTRRCDWCRFPFATGNGPGRPRKYCSQRCRQWDWVARQRARELALSEDQLVMTRSELDRLRDDLYILQCALEDAEHDLELDLAATDLRAVIQWILEAAEPLRSRNDLASETGTA